ncbi:MAG: 1-acyl-sn-glycerol-3-phosphate acyltransferase [Vicinamibacterales bacterium]
MSGRADRAEAFPRDWTMAHVVAPGLRLLSHYFRATISGAERIPCDRPVIYVGKHPRTYLYLETMLLGLYAFWEDGRPPFRVLEETHTTLHHVPVLGWLRRRLGPIPASAARALHTLERGESILIFPGGTRELYGAPDRLQWEGRTGFARLAMRSGASVVPFAIAGADGQHPWRVPLGAASLWLPPVPLPVRLQFRFGEPMAPPGRGPGVSKATADAFAAEVAAAARDLLNTQASAFARAVPRAPSVSEGAGPGRSVAAAATLRRPRGSADTAHVDHMDLDPRRWRYRFGCVRLASWLSRYHRVRLHGAAARGPCIYVTHHGAGYLSGDLAVAVYQLAWRQSFERDAALQPLRVVASWNHGIERAIPGLAWLKRSAGLIDPSEASCLAALERGEQLLITPGGHRESSPCARDYRLQWNERYGFVRLALRTGVPVVPLAVVGGYGAYPGFGAGRFSFWCPLPLPARLDVAVGEPVTIARRPADASNPAVVKPLQQHIREATQSLYDRVLMARRERTVPDLGSCAR